ncbi:MAG: glycosyltransferase family 4 protein [Pyrinomonadaceae bacterium MAG19_C2-C3]|nr:glycosyltransferase family 4 protein [Pyrinomonadaceae bacterium MAG19_C2-C3]
MSDIMPAHDGEDSCSAAVNEPTQSASATKPSVLLIGSFLSSSVSQCSVGEDLAARLAAEDYSVMTTSAKVNRAARLCDMILTAWRARRDYEVAIVEVFSGLAFGWAEAACATLRLAGKPYVLALHGGNLPRFAARHPRRVRRLLSSAAAVVAPSGYLLEGMMPYRTDVQLMPNPLDVKLYEFRKRDCPQPRLVWLRAFKSLYNPTLAPKAAALLVDEFPELQLLMVGGDKGDGTMRETRETAVALGVSERVQMPGGVPRGDVPAWLNKGDIFLNTTHVDNTPVSVLEAMACGLCVVSTNVGGIPHLLTHEEDALLVPPDDAEAMAKAVRRLLHEHGLAARLSQNARRKAEAMDWSQILPHWTRLLTKVANADSSVHLRTQNASLTANSTRL